MHNLRAVPPGERDTGRRDAEDRNRRSAGDRTLADPPDAAAASHELVGRRTEVEVGRQLPELFVEIHGISSKAGEEAGRSVSAKVGERRSLASAFDDVLFTVPTETPTCAATSASLRST